MHAVRYQYQYEAAVMGSFGKENPMKHRQVLCQVA